MNAEERQFEIARSLFREANDAFFLFDPVTQIVVDLNPAAQRLTGLEKHLACTMSLARPLLQQRIRRSRPARHGTESNGVLSLARGVLFAQGVGRGPAGQHQCEPDSHRARAGRTGRGPRHQRPQAGPRGPRAGGGSVQQPGRIHRCRRLGTRRQGSRGLPEPGVRDDHGLAACRLDRPPVRRVDSPRRP